MGAAESRQLNSGDEAAPTSGYHVVRVAANSPAHLAGIEPFFDFCVGLDGQALNVNQPNSTAGSTAGADDSMGAWKRLEEKEGTQVTLNVWSSKRQEMRDVVLVPSRSWSATTSTSPDSGNANVQPSLLGLTLRPCAPHLALSSVWHILDILEESPAESAGLVPFGDYVIGWAGGVLRHEGDFYELVELHEGRPLRLYVYNSDYDHTREVIIVPNREWGGEGLLGCGVGFGLLHRIPRPQDRPPTAGDHEGDGEEDTIAGAGAGAYAGEEEASQITASNSIGSNQSRSGSGSGGGGIPQSSTDPNLYKQSQGPPPRGGPPPPRSQHLGGGGGVQSVNGSSRLQSRRELSDGEEDEEEEGHTSGVTISMRRDEEEDEEEEGA